MYLFNATEINAAPLGLHSVQGFNAYCHRHGSEETRRPGNTCSGRAGFSYKLNCVVHASTRAATTCPSILGATAQLGSFTSSAWRRFSHSFTEEYWGA